MGAPSQPPEPIPQVGSLSLSCRVRTWRAILILSYLILSYLILLIVPPEFVRHNCGYVAHDSVVAS